MKDAAIQILIYNPNLAKPVPPEEERGVVVNPRLRQRFEQFVPIGVYLEGSDLKYYFFDQCDKDPKIYSSLAELKRDLPKSLDNLFEKDPKLFIMGHASDEDEFIPKCFEDAKHKLAALMDALVELKHIDTAPKLSWRP